MTSPDLDLSVLTRRELEVAELIGAGFTNEQIAQKLVLTAGTVANHVANILGKLGLQSRVQVAVLAAQQKQAQQSDDVLSLLSRLREVVDADPADALQHVSDVLAAVFGADKVDVFIYQPSGEILVALGTSQTPMGIHQRELGLDRLPLSNGGRAAWVFQQWQAFRDGNVEEDPFELVGLRQGLGIRSTIAAPLEISPSRRGLLLMSSAEPQHFTDAQLQLLQFVAYWVGLVANRHLRDEPPPH
jgi:DNA-binding CsgD family transcriptional regulator